MARLPLLPVLFIAVCARTDAITIRVTEQDGARVQVALSPDDVLRVDLPSHPAAGEEWILAGKRQPQLEQLGSAQRVFGGRLSNQGTSSFAWRAIAPGQATLDLRYGTPVHRTDSPERTVNIVVNVAPEALSTAAKSPDALAQMTHVGTYTRQQPCADCVATRETLELYRGSTEDLFLLHRRYVGAPGGDLTLILSGLWHAVPGTADPTATVDILESPLFGSQFRVDGDQLIEVDAQQIPIPAPSGINTAFHRQTAP